MTSVDRPNLDAADVSFLGRSLPETFQVTVHVIAPGDTLECWNECWRDALAVVEHGSVELQTVDGALLRLAEGATFSLALTGPVLIRNTHSGGVVITTVRRTGWPGGATTEKPRPHAATVPRTTLLYATEHLDPSERQHYRNLKAASLSG